MAKPNRMSADENTALRGLLRHLRLKAGYTQEEIATHMKRTPSWMCDYERGGTAGCHVSMAEGEKIARFCGVDGQTFAKQLKERLKRERATAMAA